MVDEERIPARYIGKEQVTIRDKKNHQDGNGNPRINNLLSSGDTIMLPASEVLGQTYWHENANVSHWLGAGSVVLPQHQGKSREELDALGYEFHMPSANYEPLLEEHKQYVVTAPPQVQTRTTQKPMFSVVSTTLDRVLSKDAEEITSEPASSQTNVASAQELPTSSPQAAPILVTSVSPWGATTIINQSNTEAEQGQE